MVKIHCCFYYPKTFQMSNKFNCLNKIFACQQALKISFILYIFTIHCLLLNHFKQLKKSLSSYQLATNNYFQLNH